MIIIFVCCVEIEERDMTALCYEMSPSAVPHGSKGETRTEQDGEGITAGGQLCGCVDVSV